MALGLFLWGNLAYPPLKAGLSKKALKVIAWGSQRSYCAFLIHFSFILLANAIYIATGLAAHENGLIALLLMLGVLMSSWCAANYLYRWVELPSMKLKI